MLNTALDHIANAPVPLIAAYTWLPHPAGSTLAWASGSDAPASLSALYAAPPSSLLNTYQIGTGHEVAPVENLECYPSTGPNDNFVARGQDSLGMGGLLAMLLSRGVDVQDAWALAQQWRTDRLTIFFAESGGAGLAVAWHVRFADEDTAAIVQDVLEERVRRRRRSRSTAPTEVSYYGPEVRILATSDAETLFDWGDACGDAQAAATTARFSDLINPLYTVRRQLFP